MLLISGHRPFRTARGRLDRTENVWTSKEACTVLKIDAELDSKARPCHWDRIHNPHSQSIMPPSHSGDAGKLRYEDSRSGGGYSR